MRQRQSRSLTSSTMMQVRIKSCVAGFMFLCAGFLDSHRNAICTVEAVWITSAKQ